MWRIASYTPHETLDLGQVLGAFAMPGTVFALNGDLGAGKTLLAKGIALGLDVDDHITSPTFTIVNQYLNGRWVFNHMDIYRINHPEELEELGIEEYFDSDSVSVVEWPDMLGDILPADAIRINMSKEYDPSGKEWRTIVISTPDEEDQEWLEEALNNYAHIIH